MDVRYATKVGRRGGVFYAGVEYPLTAEEYDALALPGAGAPPNPTKLTDEEWRLAWERNEVVATGAHAFDTPDGKLALGDVYIEPETGNLLANLGTEERVYKQPEFTVAAGKLNLLDTKGDAVIVDNRVVPVIKGGAVAFDATANGKVSGAASSLTFSHTCTGSNLALGVGAGSAISTSDPTGVTYNAVAMTKQHSDPLTTDSDNCTIWSLLSPATGANNVVITYSGSGDIQGGSVSATGVGAITGPTGAHGSSNSPSVTVTSATGDLVYGHVVAFLNRTTTAGTGETERYDFIGTVSTLDSHGFTEDGAATVTINPTLSASNEWSISAFNFQASGGGGGSTVKALAALGVG